LSCEYIHGQRGRVIARKALSWIGLIILNLTKILYVGDDLNLNLM